jgi:hypothetical protein
MGMTLPKLTEKAQKVFNAWVRRRDAVGDYFKCISCGQVHHVSLMDAGHYIPVKNGSAWRFDEDNVHGECKGCNGFDDFHLVGYRKNLIEKVGTEKVEHMEANRRQVKKWSRAELEEVINKYK